jgi:hypothetical protein
MDMGEWLRSIGLGQYDRDNEFDDDVLRNLTADDQLGVTIVGHRGKIMTAIAELSASAAAPAALLAPSACHPSSRLLSRDSPDEHRI